MNRRFREAGKAWIAFLALLTLMVQSVLPVYADTVDNRDGGGSGYEASDENVYSLPYFDRIAVNSVRGILTIRSGDEFSISFAGGWDETPGFSVQDDILVVSGRKSAGMSQAEQSGDGTAVVLGEDEPAANSAGQSQEPAETPAAAGGTAETTNETAPVDEPGSDESPEMMITIPAGIGLDTLRVAMESGELNINDVTANSVTIQSGAGNLIMGNVSLGNVDVYYNTGSVSMADCSFGSLNIGMSEGTVSVAAGSELSGCRMELRTGEGEITFNGAEQGTQYLQPGNGKRFLTIQVGAGNIDISE